ncbi:MAG: DEAD/DEAH box helicase [Pseudomonadota bacterium]
MRKQYVELLTVLNISESYIVNTFGDRTVQRGTDYFRRDYVKIIEVLTHENGSLEVHSEVTGSSGKIYDTSVEILPSRLKKTKASKSTSSRTLFSKIRVESDCSCPVGFQCKHGLAAVLAFAQFVTDSEKPKTVGGDNTTPPSAVDYWLNDLQATKQGNNSTSFSQNQPSEPHQYQLFYILTPDRDNGNSLKLETYKVKHLKRGGYGKLVNQDLNYILMGFQYDEFYYNHLDEEISRLLVDKSGSGNYFYNNTNNKYDIEGDVGQLALQKILQTQRAFWREYIAEKPALKLGGPRLVNIQWQEVDGNYQLSSKVTPAVNEIFRINDLYYIDALEHKLGLLEHHSLTTEQVIKLLSAPAVPQQEAEKVSLQLLKIWPNANIPMPVDLGIKEQKITAVTPIADVLLHSFQVTDYGSNTGKRRIHQLTLRFDYQGQLIQPETQETPYIHIKDRTRYQIERNLEAEQQAVLELMSHQLVPLYETGDTATNLELYFTSESQTETIWLWHDFQIDIIPELEKQGWRFSFDDSFMLNFDDADNWYANLDSSEDDEHNDWFSISMGIELNGEKINLLPTLVELLSSQNSPAQLREKLEQNSTIILPIDSERWVRLPSERLITIFDTLVELYDKTPLDNDGNLMFSKYQALHLNELLNDPSLRWKGADELAILNNKIRDFKGIEKIEIPRQVQVELRDYQHDGLNWLQFLREYQFNGILADDMGLGKTVQALVNLLYEKQQVKPEYPSLVVAPTSLMGNWKRETERFTPDLKILVLHGSDRAENFDKLSQYDIILTTYQLILRDAKLHQQQNYHYIILDESQNIKNAKAKTAQIIFTLKSNFRLCLTGTPMENHLGELWSMFHFLMPGYLGTHERFTRLFRSPIEKSADMQRQSQLQKRLQPFMLRRTKDAVATELPKKTEIIRTVPLSGRQRDLYETVRLAMDKKVQVEIGKKGLARSHIIVLDALLKLRQTCCDPRLLSLDIAKQVNESAKLEMLMEMLPEMLEEGRKILIFSQFVKMLNIIENELKNQNISYTKLTGQTKKRDEAINSFQEGKVDVFLISLKAGGVGLNLTAADTVIHYDPWWNPAAERQATDRAHRIGQDKPVFVYKLLTEETVEEKILALQQKKQSLADAIYSGKQQSALFTQDELVSLLKPLD